MIVQSKRLIGIVLATALLLLIPLVAMQFTDDVKWTLFDFMLMGAVLFGVALSKSKRLLKFDSGSPACLCPFY